MEEEFTFDSADDEFLVNILSEYDNEKTEAERMTAIEEKVEVIEEKEEPFDPAKCIFNCSDCYELVQEDTSSSLTEISDDDDTVLHAANSALKRMQERKMKFEEERSISPLSSISAERLVVSEEEEESFSPAVVRSSILIRRLEKCNREKRDLQIKVADLELQNTTLVNKCKHLKQHVKNVNYNVMWFSLIMVVTMICIN